MLANSVKNFIHKKIGFSCVFCVNSSKIEMSQLDGIFFFLENHHSLVNLDNKLFNISSQIVLADFD